MPRWALSRCRAAVGNGQRLIRLHGSATAACGSELPQGRSGDEMALQVEGVVDGGMHAERPLCGAGRFEPLHFPLAPSHNLVRVLGAIARAPRLLMTAGQTELPERSGIGGQLVGNRALRRCPHALFAAQSTPFRIILRRCWAPAKHGIAQPKPREPRRLRFSERPHYQC